ncbi:MAG TPA: cupredoxin family copper-binding protein [Candidatus Saccharimonadales bacterium]|nr:cupredoxin family copper-binding protein [Candidatus Saccharimonadales bacterium]
MRNAVIAAVVIVILAVGGWVLFGNNNNSPASSDTNNSSDMSNMDMSSSSSTPPNQQTPQATNKVSIQNFAFSPASITVKKGTTVTWTNNDSTAHTVTADSGDGPNSQLLSQGQSYSFTFNQTGTFSYHCSIHTYMTGMVTVTN